jgi:hypothetical protein
MAETVKQGNILAEKAGVSERAFRSCLCEEKYEDVVSKVCKCFRLFDQGFHRLFGHSDAEIRFNVDCEEV